MCAAVGSTCVLTACTPTKQRTHSDVTQTSPSTTSTFDVATTTATTSPSFVTASRNKTLKQAVLERDFTAASALLEDAAFPVSEPVRSLVHGYVALHSSQPQLAAQRLSNVGTNLTQVRTWQATWLRESLLQLPNYIEHVEEISQSHHFHQLAALAHRLLDDGALETVGKVIALAQRRATTEGQLGDEQQGEWRWLRARWRHAQGQGTHAHGDVRWLVVSHPKHPRARDALQAIERGWFGRLTSNEQIERANIAAEQGLVDVVEDALRALSESSFPSLAERAYLQGLAFFRARRFSEAIAPLDDAVRLLAPRRDQARYLAAVATARVAHPEAALQRLSVIASSTPVTENVENATFQLGRETSLLGNWREAAELYGAFIAKHPTHALVKAAHREQLIAWFAEGNYRRFIHWVRIFLTRYPDVNERLLMRQLEGLALLRLGHTGLAKVLWEDVARTAPLSFAGIAARQRLMALGEVREFPVVNGPVEERVSLPPLVAELELAGLGEQAESVLQTMEPQLRREHGTKQDLALCQLYGELTRATRRYQLARTLAPRLGLRDAPQLMPGWLWPCLYPRPYANSVEELAHVHRVSASLIYAVMRQESAFRERVVSPAGAHGLMQLIEPTAQRVANELGRTYDARELDYPHQNVEYGTFYLNKLQSHFGHVALVAAAYNAGPNAAARWFAAGRQLPLEAFVARIPYDETRGYVQRVLENWLVYESLRSLGTDVPKLALEFDDSSVEPAIAQPVMYQAPDGFY